MTAIINRDFYKQELESTSFFGPNPPGPQMEVSTGEQTMRAGDAVAESASEQLTVEVQNSNQNVSSSNDMHMRSESAGANEREIYATQQTRGFLCL